MISTLRKDEGRYSLNCRYECSVDLCGFKHDVDQYSS